MASRRWWSRIVAPSRGPDEESTAAGIYGLIISAAVMVAGHAKTALTLAAVVVFTLLTYWVAERYSRLVAERIHSGRRPHPSEVRRQLTQGWAIVTASGLPVLVLLLATRLGSDLTTATMAALMCTTALLSLAGWEIGRGGRLSLRERLLSSAVTGLFGIAMIVLKAVLH